MIKTNVYVTASSLHRFTYENGQIATTQQINSINVCDVHNVSIETKLEALVVARWATSAKALMTV